MVCQTLKNGFPTPKLGKGGDGLLASDSPQAGHLSRQYQQAWVPSKCPRHFTLSVRAQPTWSTTPADWAIKE